MKRYTKEYIETLLDKFMAGTSTLEEEDVLARFFRQGNVPREWEDYRLLFREIDAMRQNPQEIESENLTMQPENRRKRWIWGVAAAVVAGIFYVAMPSKLAETTNNQPLTAKIDSATNPQILTEKNNSATNSPLLAKIDSTTTIQPEIQAVESKTDSVSRPKEPVQSPKRSRRKARPTMTDHDKAYVLMAQAEQEIRDVNRQLAQCQEEIIVAQLAAYGYIPVMQEDGTIIYINEQQNLIAYED